MKMNQILLTLAFTIAISFSGVSKYEIKSKTDQAYGFSVIEECAPANQVLENDCSSSYLGLQCTVLLDNWEVAPAYSSALNIGICIIPLRRR